MMTFAEILFIIFATVYYLILLLRYKAIGNAVKGEDGKLDLVDVVKVIWIALFPLGFLASLFLGLQVQEIIWLSVDMIFFLLILKDGKDAYFAYLNGKTNEKQNKQIDTPSANSDDDAELRDS